MASKDTGGQKQTGRSDKEVEETAAAETSDVQERQDKLSDDVDAILDEIDEVLEENAEEFVRSYVQKGGAVGRASEFRNRGEAGFDDESEHLAPSWGGRPVAGFGRVAGDRARCRGERPRGCPASGWPASSGERPSRNTQGFPGGADTGRHVKGPGHAPGSAVTA